MPCTLSLEAKCLRLRLHAGAEVVCRDGSLWLTFDLPDRPSPDVLLAAGERYRLHADTDVFLAALHGAGPVVCGIESRPFRASAGSPWLRWLRRAWAS